MPNSKARNRPGVKLGGTLILFTVLFGLVDRHVFIYKSVRTFFHPIERAARLNASFREETQQALFHSLLFRKQKFLEPRPKFLKVLAW